MYIGLGQRGVCPAGHSGSKLLVAPPRPSSKRRRERPFQSVCTSVSASWSLPYSSGDRDRGDIPPRQEPHSADVVRRSSDRAEPG
eukprot:538220-Rhodomonas_salina.1